MKWSCRVWGMDLVVNDPNCVLLVLMSLIYTHYFSLLNFLPPFTCQQKIPQTIHNCACKHLSESWVVPPHELFLQSGSLSRSLIYFVFLFWRCPWFSALVSLAIFLGPQLLLWVYLLVFPHDHDKKYIMLVQFIWKVRCLQTKNLNIWHNSNKDSCWCLGMGITDFIKEFDDS